MHPYAAGHCGDLLLDKDIIGYGLASQALGRLYRQTRLTEIIYNTKKLKTPKPNETKLALLQVAFYARKQTGPIL